MSLKVTTHIGLKSRANEWTSVVFIVTKIRYQHSSLVNTMFVCHMLIKVLSHPGRRKSKVLYRRQLDVFQFLEDHANVTSMTLKWP